MLADLDLFCVGAAAVVDTVLLLSVLERRNWRYVPIPVVAMIAGVCLFHGGEFANLLLAETQGPWFQAARGAAMSLMAAGLLLMPSAMLHAVVRLWRTGFKLDAARDPWHILAYLPMLVLPAAMRSLAAAPGRPFLELMSAYAQPYVTAVCLLNLVAIFTFVVQRRRSRGRHELRRFLTWISAALAALTGLLLFAFFVTPAGRLAHGSPLLLAVMLSPSAVVLLFAYFVIRYRFMQLMVERTFVYGALLAAALLFHRLVVQPVNAQLGERLRVDVGVVEGVVVFVLILLYQPVRRRVAEALGYLVGRSADDVRDRTRRISVAIWKHVDDQPQQLLDWFVDSLRDSLRVDVAAAWLFDDRGKPLLASASADRFDTARVAALHSRLPPHGSISSSGRRQANLAALDELGKIDASLAVRVDHEGISGLLLLGRGRGGELGEEQCSAVLLLAEQLGATLHNGQLQRERLEAERRAAQSEKLSTLGLLTSCLAHEIKNPLSSIKTIATVLAEQLGSQQEPAEDVRLILDEVERLSATTSQFLAFARPAETSQSSARLGPIVAGAAHVLSHLANQHCVTIDVRLNGDLPPIRASQNALTEVVFNLLLNSIQAAGQQGRVSISARRNGRRLVAVFHDDGPGIPAEIQQRIFEPFVTTKPDGTGLGLFIVSRTVRELGGEIQCRSDADAGTEFSVALPLADAEDADADGARPQ